MKNKLYIVCPFSLSESYVRHFVDENGYFLTAKGLFLDCSNIEFIEAVCDVIESCEIQEIVLVGNEDCRFIDMILQDEIDPFVFSDVNLLTMYLDNYTVLKEMRLEKKKCFLINEVLTRLELELKGNGLLSEKMKKLSIPMSRLLITQEDNKQLQNTQSSNQNQHFLKRA